MKALIYRIAIVLLMIAPITSYAQKPPIKLGDISKEEFEMEQYDLDPDAEAVVLCDFGYRTWMFNTGEGEWKHELKRICRIKIFSDDGYKWATESVLLYDHGGIEENISQIKGFTYNLEDGKVVKTKLGKDNVFEEETSERYRKV